MRVCTTPIAGLLILEPAVHRDARGFFVESYSQKDFDAAVGDAVRFVQDNHSRSARGVLRGLHYQLPPHAQGRLVRVAHGAVFDVAVDIRRASPTFGRWHGVQLNADQPRMVWLPPGLAHGFLVTSESADFVYKSTAYYAPEAERGIRWNDPALAIAWPALATPLQLTGRDAAAPLFADAAGLR